MVSLAFRISVARSGFALGTCQLVAVPFQGFELVPRLTLASEMELAAGGAGIGLDVGRRDGARFVEAKLAAVDDEQPLGAAERTDAIARAEAPAALQGGGYSARRRRLMR